MPPSPLLSPVLEFSLHSEKYRFHKPQQTGNIPILPTIQQPANIHLNPSRRESPRASPASFEKSSRGQGSWSSENTASSTASTSKIYNKHSPSPYLYSSHMEQASMQQESHLGVDRRPSPLPGTAPQSMSDAITVRAEDNVTIFRYIHEQEDNGRENDHGLWVLAWLALLDPFFSASYAFYSILVSILLLILLPVHLCRSSDSVGDRSVKLLAPVFRKHLQLMCAKSVQDAHTFEFRPATLVLIQIASPFVSIGVALSTWVAAGFWLFTLMMGNPDGTERGDDGRTAVLGMRNWFEKFLLNAVR